VINVITHTLQILDYEFVFYPENEVNKLSG